MQNKSYFRKIYHRHVGEGEAPVPSIFTYMCTTYMLQARKEGGIMVHYATFRKYIMLDCWLFVLKFAWKTKTFKKYDPDKHQTRAY